MPGNTKSSDSGETAAHDGSQTAERIIVCLLVFIAIFSVLIYGAVDTGAIALLSIVSALVLIFWSWSAVSGKAFRISATGLLIPMIALGLVGLVQLLPFRTLAIPDELLTIRSVTSLSLDPYATRFFLMRLFLYLIFFAASVTFICNLKRVRAVTVTIVVFGSLIGFYSILQRVEDPASIYGMRTPSQAIPFGTYVNRHHFAALMEMTLGLTLGLLFGGGLQKNRMPFLVAAAAVMGVAIALTQSRGGMLAMVISIVFLIVLSSAPSHGRDSSRESRARTPLSLPIRLAGGALFLALVIGLALFTGGGESVSRGLGLDPVPGDISSGRLGYWSVALKIFSQHPFIGAGLDAFGVAYTRYDPSNGVFRVEQAHNDYLQILADGGLVAFIIAAVFIYMLLRKGYRTVSLSHDAFRRGAAIGALAGCVAVLAHSFVDFPLRTPANAYVFLLLAAIAVVEVPDPRGKSRSRRGNGL